MLADEADVTSWNAGAVTLQMSPWLLGLPGKFTPRGKVSSHSSRRVSRKTNAHQPGRGTQ